MWKGKVIDMDKNWLGEIYDFIDKHDIFVLDFG